MKIKRSDIEKSGPVTLERVADLAGVSPSTVSRILNGSAVVSTAKKKAVEDAIAHLGFVPNPVARGLAGGRTLSIGVVTQAIDSPFYGPTLRGIEEELDTAGYSPLFVSAHWDAASEARCIDVLRSRRVDGLIVLHGRLSDQALKNTSKNLPIVITGRSIKGPGLFSLNFDNFTGGVLATEHLIKLGHRRIAFIKGDPLHPDATERFRGYKSALQAAGIAFDSRLVMSGDYQEITGVQATNHLLDSGQKFTAIFAANDQMAFGAALSLHQHSLRIPEDMSLVGFDNLARSLYVIPPMSTVNQPAYELGQLAATAMLQMLAGKKPTGSLPAPQLIARDSSARP
ncbi:MAG: LacI family DNA-binding transcriptional regulator [Betaproteobacteria bacterium]|jgi:LacI family transcriptional regulator|nr:LacI family DNA-binding transcriptional regulator [Burkholderiales bacterium]NBX89714.1 LacI family DNA-binding transcriptional regulator [Betaproteobacteria bacterium]